MVLIAVTSFAAIFWWRHTPYFAIQQIGTSIAQRDSRTFYEYCDANQLVNSITEELFLKPAIATRGMSDFQNYVAAGAIVITKNKLDAALLSGIDRMVTPVPHTSLYHVFPQYFSLKHNPYPSIYAPGEPPQDRLAVNSSDLRDFAKSLGQELKVEQEDLKKLAAQRMHEYADAHQNQLIGRLLAGATGAGSIKDIFTEYGFQAKNVRKMYFHQDEDRQICTVEFFSPKVNREVPISVELIPVSPGQLFSAYKVIRMWRLKQTMVNLGEDTDTQVQELVAYSLQDIAPDKARDRTGDLMKRIGRHESSQKLLQQLKGRF